MNSLPGLYFIDMTREESSDSAEDTATEFNEVDAELVKRTCPALMEKLQRGNLHMPKKCSGKNYARCSFYIEKFRNELLRQQGVYS